MPILVNSICADYSKVWVYFLRVYRISFCFFQRFWFTVQGCHTFISSGLFPSRQRTSIIPFGLRLKYILLYRDYCLFILSRDILLYRPDICSSLTSIAHYPTVYTTHHVAFRMNSTDNTELNYICCSSQRFWLTVRGSHTFISSGLFPSRQRTSIIPFGLRLKYIPLYRDYCLFVLSRDILLYRPVIRSSLISIAHYPTVYKTCQKVGWPGVRLWTVCQCPVCNSRSDVKYREMSERGYRTVRIGCLFRELESVFPVIRRAERDLNSACVREKEDVCSLKKIFFSQWKLKRAFGWQRSEIVFSCRKSNYILSCQT